MSANPPAVSPFRSLRFRGRKADLAQLSLKTGYVLSNPLEPVRQPFLRAASLVQGGRGLNQRTDGQLREEAPYVRYAGCCVLVSGLLLFQ